MRTHEAGSLRAGHAGQTVTLAGWVARRRDHGGVIFIDLRDASGVSQVVFREGEMAERAHRLRAEFCIKITGEVVVRPEGNENPEIPTGEIEVLVTDLDVLSESAVLPFGIDDRVGSLEPGKLADLIVLERNPLEDLRHSEHIRYTMVNGRLFDARTMNEIGNCNRPRGKFYWELGHTKNIVEWKNAWAHQ